jgi:hypothetical protein
VAGRARAGFEVEQVELLAELDVIERLENKLADFTSRTASSPAPSGASGWVMLGIVA